MTDGMPRSGTAGTGLAGDRALAVVAAQAEASPDGLLVVSPDGRMLTVNRRFAELWRFPPEVVATGDDEAALAAALERVADPDAFIARIRECYANPTASSHEEVELRDGRVLDRYGSPLHDVDGTYLGWAWYFRDVTPAKRTEAQLRELADTLQASLLPPRPPRIPGLQVSTRYRAGTAGLLVGGDFYDVFRMRSNDWGVVIGDVCGKGAGAAALTALARYSVRAAAVHHESPSDVLGEVNRALVDDLGDDERFASVCYARLEQDVCGAWATLACAGHPPPIVVRRAGWVDVRGQPGTLLGLFEDVDLADDRVGLGPGDALVFCTDGITEARDASGELFAEERLPAELLASTACDADVIADRLVAAALAYAGGEIGDDLAVLVLRVPPEAGDDPTGRLESVTGAPIDEAALPGYPVGEPHWGRNQRPAPPREARLRLAAEPASVGAARRFVDSVLHSWRMSHLTAGDIQLCTSEIVTNGVRHTSTPVTTIVRYDGSRVRVEVGDGSRALPRRLEPSLDATTGRGMAIVEMLAAAWGVTATVEGKRVWFEFAAD